jgi:ribonuclease HI
MNITIFCDASYCDRSKIGGYGIWIKTERGTHRFKGAFKEPLSGPGRAEMAALANALHVAHKIYSPGADDTLFVTTDCLNAIETIKMPTVRKNNRDNQALLYIRDLLLTSKARYDFRHVKAHKGNVNPRSAVNTWCDRAARAEMRALRKVQDAAKVAS